MRKNDYALLGWQPGPHALDHGAPHTRACSSEAKIGKGALLCDVRSE